MCGAQSVPPGTVWFKAVRLESHLQPPGIHGGLAGHGGLWL